MTDIYYQLSDGTNTITFVLAKGYPRYSVDRQNFNIEIPYSPLPLISDMVTGTIELTLLAGLKAGTGFPYATVKDIYTALDALNPSSYNSGWTLNGGDWNGTTWTVNTNYPHAYGSGSNKLLLKNLSINPEPGAYDTGEVTASMTFQYGTIL